MHVSDRSSKKKESPALQCHPVIGGAASILLPVVLPSLLTSPLLYLMPSSLLQDLESRNEFDLELGLELVQWMKLLVMLLYYQ